MYRKLYLLFAFSFLTFLGFAGNGNEKSLLERSSTVEDTTAQANAKKVRVARLDTIENKDFLGKISVSGQARFFMVYRDMQESYGDMVTADKNLAFTDYPVLGAGTSNSSGQPFIDLIFGMKPSRNFSLDLGFAMYHAFNGQQDSLSKATTVRSDLNFGARLNTDYGLFRVRAGGGVLWMQQSPLTISGLEVRQDNFDRLPWDWYTNSWQKYNDFFNASVNLGSESYGNQAFQGFNLMGDGLPGNFGFSVMYGRTNQSIDQAKADFFPSSLFAGRLYNYLGDAKVGVNIFQQKNYLSNYSDDIDQRQIGTIDIEYFYKGIRFYTEFGAGRVDNFLSDGKWGGAFVLQATVPESKIGLPLNVQAFNIAHEVASNVSSVFNSNQAAPGRGLGAEDTYNTTLFINQVTGVGQMANNRRALSVSTGKGFGQFHVELGYQISQEIANKYDTLTFAHQAFAYSRSRFNPWVWTAGPYTRIQNGFRMSNEKLTITDAATGEGTDYRKGFATLDVALKFKTQLLNKGLIFKYYSSYSSVKDGFAIAPSFSEDNAFIRTWYQQLTGFYNLSKKVKLVGMIEFETNKANDRTQLSIYNRKPIDQLGQGWGYGFDYDFSDFAGVYLRHRWMRHDDVNFIRDRFKGQEITLELKVFF